MHTPKMMSRKGSSEGISGSAQRGKTDRSCQKRIYEEQRGIVICFPWLLQHLPAKEKFKDS